MSLKDFAIIAKLGEKIITQDKVLTPVYIKFKDI
jgi:hypothetical protein